MEDNYVNGRMAVGGLAGHSEGFISGCYATGLVEAEADAGGLVGYTNKIITQCYSSGSVTANGRTGGFTSLGGLIGLTRGPSSVIYDCYSTANVSSTSASYQTGGFIGINKDTVYNCYSTGLVSAASGSNGRGFCSLNQGSIARCYWDKETSGKSSSSGGTGKMTAEMIQEGTFAGWDFDEIWDIDEGQSYPYFMEPRVLEGLEIVGPDQAAEDSQTQYKAIAHYDIGSPKDVTGLAEWSVDDEAVAGIDENGVLTTVEINRPRKDIIVSAEYTEGDIAANDDKDVAVFAICPSGSALEFDGVGDYVDLGNDGSLDVTELTWALWIKRGETTYSNERALISNTGPKTSHGEASGTYALQIDEGGQYQDKIQFVRHGMPVEQCPLSNTIINDMNWHHIAVTRYINGDVTIYIDGYEDATGYIPERTAYGKTFIGTGHTNYSNFKGSIDEIAIYNKALSAEEIQGVMLAGPDVDDDGLVGYWDFDDGEGQIAADVSGNGNDGTLGSTEDVDDNDPCWVDDVAPVGLCSLGDMVERGMADVLDIKEDILYRLLIAIDKELDVYRMLDEAFKAKELGTDNKGDVVQAKQKIHSAVGHETQALKAVNMSLDKIYEALEALDFEPDTN